MVTQFSRDGFLFDSGHPHKTQLPKHKNKTMEQQQETRPVSSKDRHQEESESLFDEEQERIWQRRDMEREWQEYHETGHY